MGRFHFVVLVIFSLCEHAISQTPQKPTTLQLQQLEDCLRMIKEIESLANAGKYREALEISGKVLKLQRSLLGEHHTDYLAMVEWVCGLQELVCDFKSAKVAWAELYNTRRKLLGEDHWQTLDAKLALKLAERMAALGPDERVLLKEEKRLLGETVALKSTGNWPELIVINEKILAIRKVLHGEDHFAYADVLNDLGLYFNNQGMHAKSEPLLLAALKIRKTALGEKHPRYATTLSNIAAIYEVRGVYGKSEEIEWESLKIRKEALGVNHPEYAFGLNNLASIYEDRGHYSKAEPLYLEALKILAETPGRKHSLYPIVLGNLAGLYSDQGAFEKAEQMYGESLREIKATVGEKHPHYVIFLGNLANEFFHQRQYAKAEVLYLQSAKYRKELFGDKHPGYSTVLNNLANVYRALGQADKAEQYFLGVLRLRKEIFGQSHPKYSTTLRQLASLYYSQKRYDECEPLSLECLRIDEEILGEQHPTTAGSLNDLAALYATRSQPAKAEPLLIRALRIIQKHLEESSAIQSENDQIRHSSVYRLYLDNYLSLTNAETRTLHDAVFRWQGAVTARQAFARLSSNSTPEIRKSLEELRDVSRLMNRLTQDPPEGVPKPVLAKRLKDLNGDRENFQKKLSGLSKDFAAYQSHLKLTPADLQKSLPEGTALVDFLVHGESVSAFIITQSSIQRVVLTGGKDLDDELALFLGELSLERTRPVTHKDDVAVKLRKRIWEPLEEHLKGAQRVLICPDGPLCRLPFAALPGSDPKKYLLEERSIIVVPVPQLLPGLLNAQEKKDVVPSLLAVGDVDFNGDPAAGEPVKPAPVALTRSGGLSWSQLPQTKGEVEVISALFGQRSRVTVKSVTGKHATEAALEREMPKYRYLHFATHGFFAPPKFVRQFKDGAEGVAVPVLPPGLSSGIVCAGANKPTFQSSGILTATQIAELDLRNVELVVLSACETGLGELAGGEGVLGLQRAFQIAGARSTVSSLWAIPDKSTAELMKRMYENHLAKGMPASDALREAQLWVLNHGEEVGAFEGKPTGSKRTPPKFWAAFTFAGDWR